MAKKILLIFLTVMLATACFTMTACKEPTIYTVAFDTDGGTIVEEQKVKDGDKAIKPLDPTKEGYKFDKWYLNDGTYFDFENTVIKQNITLKASWVLNQYSISFDSDGGTIVQTITDYFGAEVIVPENPTKQGYKFLGWFVHHYLMT